jgi:hypothetical protein
VAHGRPTLVLSMQPIKIDRKWTINRKSRRAYFQKSTMSRFDAAITHKTAGTRDFGDYTQFTGRSFQGGLGSTTSQRQARNRPNMPQYAATRFRSARGSGTYKAPSKSLRMSSNSSAPIITR